MPLMAGVPSWHQHFFRPVTLPNPTVPHSIQVRFYSQMYYYNTMAAKATLWDDLCTAPQFLCHAHAPHFILLELMKYAPGLNVSLGHNYAM